MRPVRPRAGTARRRPVPTPGRATGLALLALGLVVASAPPTPLHAQDDPEPIRLSAAREDGSLEVRIGGLLEEGGLVRALRSGLPLRITVVAELWSDGFFDSQRGRGEWRASVLYDPLEERYRVATGETDSTAVADSLSQVESLLQERFDLPLRPREQGRYYYLGEVRVETLSLSDLEELQQWLRGDLASAVAGETEVEDAVGSGIRRMLVRMLGLPARRLRVRSPTFEVPPPGQEGGAAVDAGIRPGGRSPAAR